MSDKFTEVTTPHGGLGEWGHVAPAEAIDRLRKHYEAEKATADSVLADIAAGRIAVYHQMGPWAMKNRRCVFVGQGGEGE